MGELGLRRGQADLESLGFSAPAFAFGFGDAGDEVVTDVHKAGSLGRVGPRQGASNAALTEMILKLLDAAVRALL
ncbi:hypothetical protein GCM10010170_024620 [Dactylosporangium salmoneum]|uniref:Uncharacterized protein n=1 Tax=Dactylosporangium salmoneum TaxID=53361 RepID=A0ABN3FZX7_9ACTN